MKEILKPKSKALTEKDCYEELARIIKIYCYQAVVREEKSCALGLGYWTRGNTECCLLATKGHPKRESAGISQLIFSPRGRHSEKPTEVREKIRKLVGGGGQLLSCLPAVRRKAGIAGVTRFRTKEG